MPIFHLAECEIESSFDFVICEKTSEKHQCKNDENCGDFATCIHGKCLCNRGLAGDGSYCTDVNECQEVENDVFPIMPHTCGNIIHCSNTLGSYSCRGCDQTLQPQGYWENGTMKNKCLAKDFCEHKRCGIGADCVNMGTSAICKCKKGFQSDGAFCLKTAFTIASSTYSIVPESSTWEGSRDICVMEGADSASFESETLWAWYAYVLYNTIKDFGYRGFWLGGKVDNTGLVVWTSNQVSIHHLGQHNKTLCMVSRNNKWVLTDCQLRHQGICERRLIETRFESDTNYEANATCVHDFFSSEKYVYLNKTCKCQPGFAGDGLICKDVDECKMGLHRCQDDAFCLNTLGSYRCECINGYFGDGKNCFLPLPYIFNNESRYYIRNSWDTCLLANEKCKIVGGHLASFETEEEWNFIAEKIHRKHKPFIE